MVLLQYCKTSVVCKYTCKYSMRQKTMRNIDYVDYCDDMEVGQETL